MDYNKIVEFFPDAVITQENENSFIVEKLNEKKRCVRIHISKNIIEIELCVFDIYSKPRYENIWNIIVKDIAELKEKAKSLFTFISFGLGNCPELKQGGALFS